MCYELIDDIMIHHTYNKFNNQLPCLVLIHDIYASKETWSYVQSHLNKKAISNIAIDIPGFGASPTLPLKYDYSYRSLAVIISLLLTRLKILKTVIIGHGTGAIVAAAVTTFSSNSNGIIMISPNFDTPPSYLKVAPSCYVSAYVSRVCTKSYQTKRLFELHEHHIIVPPFVEKFSNSYRREVITRVINARESAYLDLIDMIFCPLHVILPTTKNITLSTGLLDALLDNNATTKQFVHTGVYLHHEAPAIVSEEIMTFVNTITNSDVSV